MRKSLLRSAVLLVFGSTALLGCTSLPATGQPLNAPPVRMTTAAPLLDYTLANGLRVLIRPDHRSPVVMTQVWYRVGSADERSDQTGLSHALEHMMFKGTPKVPGEDFSRINAKFGGSNNAFTTANTTAYYQLYPASRLALALELEADRMRNLVLREEDFAQEIRVVMEERRQRTDDNPKALAYERFRLLAYPTSPLRYPVIGHMDSLQAMQLPALKDWYQRWYSPANAVLVIVGDVDPVAARQAVDTYFAGLSGPQPPVRVDTDEFMHLGERNLNLFLPVKVPLLYLGYNVPTLGSKNAPAEDVYALALLQSILDGGLSARLEQRLVREQRLLTAVSTSYEPLARGGGLWMLSAIPENGHTLLEARRALLAEIERLKTGAIDAREIQRALINLRAELAFAQDSLAEQAQMLGELATAGLDPKLLDDYPQKLAAVTPAQLARVARRYLTQDNLSTLYLAPQDSPLNPDRPAPAPTPSTPVTEGQP
jgi:zinc protease